MKCDQLHAWTLVSFIRLCFYQNEQWQCLLMYWFLRHLGLHHAYDNLAFSSRCARSLVKTGTDSFKPVLLIYPQPTRAVLRRLLSIFAFSVETDGILDRRNSGPVPSGRVTEWRTTLKFVDGEFAEACRYVSCLYTDRRCSLVDISVSAIDRNAVISRNQAAQRGRLIRSDRADWWL